MLVPLVLAVLLGSPPLAGTRVVVLCDDSTRPYVETIRGLELAGATVEQFRVDDQRLRLRYRRDDAALTLWLALGPRSARALAKAAPGPRGAALLTGREVPSGMPALTLDPPLPWLLGRVGTAFPGRRRLIVVRRKGAAVRDEEVLAAARGAGFRLELHSAANPGEAVPALEEALRRDRRGAIVLLLPDPNVVTADSIAPLAVSGLAFRVPVVGFSGYFLRAGALAAVAVDYRALGVEALSLIRAGNNVSATPFAARLVVDGRLAERLGIVVATGDGVEVR